MYGDMSFWNVQGPLLHSGDHIVPRILTVDYTFNTLTHLISKLGIIFQMTLHNCFKLQLLDL